jgi:hypothetical protein
MIYAQQWDPTRVREVLSTESRQKNRDLFLRTHSPFRRIRLDFCKEPGQYGRFVAEGDVRTIVHAAPLTAGNRLFFIVGEAGSGKSELCQWLEYAADTTSRIPIHVPRSMTRAVHVARLLRQHLPSAAPSQAAPPRTRARHAALTALMLLYERGNGVLQPATMWEPILMSEALCAHLAQALAHADDASTDTLQLLDAECLRDLCSLHGVAVSDAQVAEIAGALDHLLWQALDQALWLGDLRALLSDLSARAIARGRRPLLLIEDITAFQAMGDLLLDYLLDLTSGHYDAVIGITTGFERDQLARATLDGDLTHIHQRLRARFVLTDEDGHAYSLENNLIEFTLAYLRAVKGSSTARQAAPADSKPPFGGDLYPFTEVALQRAFSCLREEGSLRQTPRLFIEHVLAAVLLAGDIPPQTLDRSTFLERPAALFRRSDVADERLQSLLRWYGTVEDDAVTVECGIAEAWGIPVPAELRAGLQVRAARSYRSPLPGADASGDDTWQQELRELQHWLEHGGPYPSRETLKRGIEQVLLQLGDPRSLASRESLSAAQAELYYSRGDDRLPMYLDGGSGDVLGDDTYVKVQVTRAPTERAILEELVYYALSGGDLAGTSENVALTLAWAQEHWDDYHMRVRSLFATRLNGITAERLIFITWRLVSALAAAPGRDWPFMGARDAAPPPFTTTTPWDSAAHAQCYHAGESLYRWYETARRLFVGAFTYRDTLLDFGRFSSIASDIEADTMLRDLAYLPVADLRGLPFKIRPTNVSLYELLVPLQRYAAALVQFDIGRALRADVKDFSGRLRHLEHQLLMDFSLFHAQLASLRSRCGQVGVSWSDSWDEAIDTLRSLTADEVKTLYARTRAALDDPHGTLEQGPSSIWEYQDFRHRARPIRQHPYWPAIAALRQVRGELERAARERYPAKGGTITATRPYRELLAALRNVHEEIARAGTITR